MTMIRTMEASPLRILHPATNQTVEPSEELVGIAPPGAMIQLRFDRNMPQTITADAKGRWSCKAKLPAGQHSAHARLHERSGVSGSAYVTYNVRELFD